MDNTVNNIQHVEPGQPIRAVDMNAVIDNVRQRGLSFGFNEGNTANSGQQKYDLNHLRIRVYNTGPAVPLFGVAAITGVYSPKGFPETGKSQFNAQNIAAPKGRNDDRQRIVILWEDCGPEMTAYATVTGLTLCKVIFPSDSSGTDKDLYRYARAVEGNVEALEASRTSVGTCARVICTTDQTVNIGEGEAQKTATWCYVFVTPEKDLIQAELEASLYPWEETGRDHIVDAKLYAPKVTRIPDDMTDGGRITDITWEDVNETVRICSPFDFGIDDDPLESGTRVHARWDSSAGAWIAIRGGGGGSTPVTRLSVTGTAVGGMDWSAGKDMTEDEIQHLPCYATDLAVQRDDVDTYDSVALKKEYPAIYGKNVGQYSTAMGVWIPHPTVIRNQNAMATVTHSFRQLGQRRPSHYRANCTASGSQRFAVGLNENYGPHYVFNGSTILYPTHETVNGELFWMASGYAPLFLYRSPVSSEGWLVSQRLGVPYRAGMAGSNPDPMGYTRFPSSLPNRDGQEVESIGDDVPVKLQFYYPRWESANEYGEYVPVGNLSMNLDASGTFYFGNPKWQTVASGISPTLTKSSVMQGDDYAYVGEGEFPSLENGRMDGTDGKWWEVKNNAAIEDGQDFTLAEFRADDEEGKAATGTEAVYTFSGYGAPPTGQSEPVWLVTPEILTKGTDANE